MMRKFFALLLMTGFTLQGSLLMSEVNDPIVAHERCVGRDHFSRSGVEKNLVVRHLLRAGILSVRGNASIEGRLDVDGIVSAPAFVTPAGPLTVMGQAYGKLFASAEIGQLTITSVQGSVPATTGWQSFPVDSFSTSLKTTAADPTNATITVLSGGTYLVNALLTLKYPDPSADGPDDLTNYCIGVMIDDVLQNDSIGSLRISQQGGHENPGLLYSASLSGIYTLSAGSNVQFVIGADGGGTPDYIEVASANATVVQIGN